MNTPLTREQVKALPLGLTITRRLIGREKDGSPIYCPNHRERKLAKKGKRYNNRKMTKSRKKHRGIYL